MASVSKRKRGKVWYIRFQKPGRKEVTERHPGTLHESTIDRRIEWWREEISQGRRDPWEELQQKKKEEALGLNLSEAIPQYIKWGLDKAHWKTDANGQSKTANTNQSRLEWMLDGLGNMPVTDLDTDEIKYWLTGKQKLKRKGKKWVPTGEKISPVTMKSWKISINSFLRWLHEKGHVPDLRQVYLPKQISHEAKNIIKQPSGISLNQLHEFCGAVERRVAQSKNNKYYQRSDSLDWMLPCAQLTFWTMLRRDEIIHLCPEDFSEDLEYITYGFPGSRTRERFIPKAGIETLPLLQPAKAVIKRFGLHKLPKGRPIFPVSPDYLSIAFRRMNLLAFREHKFSPHAFRHGGIMHLRSVLQEPGLVTKLARHRSQETTERIYGGVDPIYLKRAVDRAPLSQIKIIG